jgi:hypothetical protein
LPFEEVSRKFIDCSRMFPEQIIEKSTEIQDIEQDIINIFNEDLSKIKKIINDTHLRIRINYKRFADPVYLLLNSLYTDESPPESKQATIRFWLANLHISKEVLVSIIRYVNNVVISNIKRDCDSYKKRTANNLLPFPRLSYLSSHISQTLHQSQLYCRVHGE